MTTEVINDVPRELLEDLRDHLDDISDFDPAYPKDTMPRNPSAELFLRVRALLATAQPAADGEREWKEDDAAACGCNYRDHPCERCWALGWKLGAPDEARAALPAKVDDPVGALVIQVEKLLCGKMGIEWAPTGMSIESLIEQLPAKAEGMAVPEGWCLVPIRTTDEMNAAGMRAAGEFHRSRADAVDEVFKAMLAAAPVPPVLAE